MNANGDQQHTEAPFLVQMAVHDLRGPLTAILNGLELTTQADDPLEADEAQRILRLCLDSGRALMRQIDSLLDVAQIESKRLPLKFESIDIREALNTAYMTLSNTFTEKGVAIALKVEDALPQVMGDREILRRVFVNLLDNALRFSPRGGQIRIEATQAQSHEAVLVGISDKGPGIPESQRDLVFEPYRRLEPDKASAGGRRGIGLGLTFCKVAVEAHQGRISVETACDEMGGARFLVSLPLKQSPVEQQPT
ncbi:MAG: hypothetical protein IPK19_17845 [Chloroflexi bacterium]|nr:hypothetical protein [Chloroflexota bacterium]